MCSAYGMELERNRLAREGQERAAADQRRAELEIAARTRLVPLEDRVARLLAKIPPEVQSQGLALSSLQASLKGRGGGVCHSGELGTILRSKFKFTRKRTWRGEAGFAALWYPPENAADRHRF